MYYVNRDKINEKLNFTPLLIKSCQELRDHWDAANVICPLAQERVLQLALESVTDVGSLLIDGFLMRDASSYEDIIEILRGEQVLAPALAESLLELVQLRKPLVQEYVSFPRDERHPIIERLPDALATFADTVNRYLIAELGQ